VVKKFFWNSESFAVQKFRGRRMDVFLTDAKSMSTIGNASTHSVFAWQHNCCLQVSVPAFDEAVRFWMICGSFGPLIPTSLVNASNKFDSNDQCDP